MQNIHGIHKWNKDTGLINTFDQYKEAAMLLEEIYEALGVIEPKQTARNFVHRQKEWNEMMHITVSEVDFLDACVDMEFILHGSKAKMGLTPEMDAESVSIVLEANQQKLNAGKDEEGKQRKPEGFITPQIRLQELLDKRVQ